MNQMWSSDHGFHLTHHVSPHVLHKILQGLNCHWPMFKMTVWPRNARIEIFNILVIRPPEMDGHDSPHAQEETLDLPQRLATLPDKQHFQNDSRHLFHYCWDNNQYDNITTLKKKKHNETLKMATSLVMQLTTWAQGRTKPSSVSRKSLPPGFVVGVWEIQCMVGMRMRMAMTIMIISKWGCGLGW